MLTSTASAPGKVILFGEHFVVYGVRAILGAINRRVTVTSYMTDAPTISICSALGSSCHGMSEPVGVQTLRPVDYIAKRLASENSYEGGFKVDIDSDIPVGVGLGSSSATCVAAAASMSGLFGERSPDAICDLAIDAERTIYGNTSGADCTACTHGGLMQYGRDAGFERVQFSERLDLVISDSQMQHSTDVMVRKVAEFADSNPKLFETLCRKESALVDSVLCRLKLNTLDLLGDSMRENQQYLDAIGVSNDVVDELIRVCAPFCTGSKITGAGGGGCIISVARNTAADAVKSLGEKNIRAFAVRIDNDGLRIH